MADYNQELKEKRSRNLRARIVFIAAAAIALSLSAAYAVFFTEVFRFSEVNLTGKTALKREDLFGEKNPYLFGEVMVRNPLVASFDINRDFFKKKLSLDITERESYAVWCVSAPPGTNAPTSISDGFYECFWIDESGLLFANAPESEGALVKSIFDYSGNGIQIGNYAASEDLLRKIFEIFAIIDRAGIEVTKYSLKSLDDMGFHAKTRDGAEIYFNLRLDQNFTYEPLLALKNEFNNLQYIDLRSENRVFYR